MARFQDSDLIEDRWFKAEWKNYELWEKVEQRLKRKKKIWVIVAIVVFLILSAVPIFSDRWAKWSTLSAARRLAQEINQIKRQAIINRSAFRLRFTEGTNLNYIIEKLESCTSARGELIRSGSLAIPSDQESFTLLSTSQGEALEIPNLVSEFCYDYLRGNEAAAQGKQIVGFGIIPAKDLAEKRLDRLSVLLLSGQSSEISFD